MNTQNIAEAYKLADFCQAYSVGLTTVYQQIKEGSLRAVKCGKKTLILRKDAETWAKSLPSMRTAQAEGKLSAEGPLQ